MIQTSFVSMASPRFRLLTDEQVEEIKRAAFFIMEKVGFKILHSAARKMLQRAGAMIKDESAKIPEHIVRECVRIAPKGFTIYDRNGQLALEVEGRKSYYGTSTGSPNTMDAMTGEIKPTRVTDIALAARIADALPNIDWVMPMGSAQDVPADSADLDEFESVVTNTTKPIVFLSYSPRGCELVYEMAAEVVGGLDTLRERPFLIAYPEPISPLVFPADVVDRIFVAADLCMPQLPGPAVLVGATCPVTIAGAVAQLMAESLMCLVLAQLRRPGCPCALSGNVGIPDMASGLSTEGCPEVSLGLAIQAEVARSFGLPTWGLAGSTDAKVVDAQAGAESAFSILAQGLAGLNLIHDVGYMDMAMVCSPAQLVLGNDIIGMVTRFLRGVEVTKETLAREVIASVGPGGHFLHAKHTVKHFRNELWRGTVMTREPYGSWIKAGAKDTAQRIQEKLRHIIDTHTVPSLPDKTLSSIQEIKLKRKEELTTQK
jgi:trimethylamine--corrinoid protein Co-methyltransferase